MILFTPTTTISDRQRRGLAESVARDMEARGECGRSASGQSAILAIHWCEQRGYMWQLTGSSKTGYHVKMIGDGNGG